MHTNELMLFSPHRPVGLFFIAFAGQHVSNPDQLAIRIPQMASDLGRACVDAGGGIDQLPADDELDRGMRCWSPTMLGASN